jgi:hypothetical protein
VELFPGARDKAKPFVKKGRKTMGLHSKTAGLPKDDL